MRKKKNRMDDLMFEHTTSCRCGRRFTFPGPAPAAIFACTCGRRMRVAQNQVRSRLEARLIVENRERFNGEACADCGRTRGHHVVQCRDAYFLLCGGCGEELREVDPVELKKGRNHAEI